MLTLVRGVAWAQGPAAPPVVWKAKWIAADGATKDTAQMPLFCKEFTLSGKPKRAVLLVAALGQGEVHLNGVKAGDAELTPGWTDYRKTVRYERYDVTKLLRGGKNIVAVMVGNGMFNVVKTPHRYTKLEGSFGVPEVLLQLEIDAADGKHEVVASDATWQSAPGPITFTSIYGGEDYDATREVPAWDSVDPSYRASDWKPVAVVTGPAGVLEPEVAPRLKVMQTYTPVKTTEPQAGVTVYDLGQNFAGWPAIVVRGAKGSVVKLIPGELLKPDGTVTQAGSGGPQWFSYALKGSGDESWHPSFSYYGFRYVQVEWTGEGTVVSLTGKAVHSTSPVTGTFESSSAMLNAIHKLIVASMHNNEVSLFTDCPTREKLGWLEQTHLIASGLMFNNDLRGLYAATDRNMADAQYEDGYVPTIAPEYTLFDGKRGMFSDSPEWDSASVLAPWAAYRFYGDRRQLERDYPVMQKYVVYLQGKAQDGIVAYGLGDWYDIGPKPPGVSQLTSLGVTGTLMLYEDAVAMQKIASLLGKSDDAATYAALASAEKTAFNAKYFDAEKGYYDQGSQTAQSMPLALGIVAEDAKAKVLDRLVSDIHAHEDHITAGDVGFPYLVRALMVNGRDDVLLAILLRKDPPSYGSQLAKGATALTEAWDAGPRSSQDHFMLGDGEEWFYRGLGGIDFDMSRADAAARITIGPRVVDGVDWVKCGYDSVLGKIESDWKREGAAVVLDITVPNGTEATIVLPGQMGVPVVHSEAPTVLVVGAGAHRFRVKMPAP